VQPRPQPTPAVPAFAIAAHSWSFPDLTLPEMLGTAARAGFRRVDVGSGSSLNTARAAEHPRALADEIRADLARYDLALSDLYLMLPRIAAASPDDERRDREIALFKALLPFARAVGAPGITVSPGLAPPGGDVDAYAAAFERAAEALREMLAAAHGAMLPLSIEPHLDSIAPTPAAALRLLDAVPTLGLTLDWAELVCQNIAHDAIAALLPRARHVHVRQAARGKLGVPFEKGAIDLARVTAALVSAGYTGTVAIELLPVVGRHGSQRVAVLGDLVKTRDALRDARTGGRRV
jgi:sugar phosphate isomerase/epimerase